MVWITGLPLPPSANSMYDINVNKKWIKRNGKPFLKTSTGKRKSAELITFQTRCELFKRQHTQSIEKISKMCHEWIQQGFMIGMDSYCIFQYDRIWSKDRKPLNLDADNRRKALQDAIFALLGIDDRYVFCGNIEKVTCIDKDLECSIVRLRPVKAQTIEQIKALMGS